MSMATGFGIISWIWSKNRSLALQGATLILCMVFTACNSVTETSKTNAAATSTTTKFADGTKAVRINFKADPSITPSPLYPSFGTIESVPTSTVIPAGYPGEESGGSYNPGISPSIYYDLDGITAITKPDWLIDFQVGVTATIAGAGSCATFGSSDTATYPLDSSKTFRVSEVNCGGVSGEGKTSDSVFFRIILDRTSTKLGANENLMVQVEYQASGLVPYSVNMTGDSSALPESMADQLWKVFWSGTLSGSTEMNPFALMVPPNYGHCSNALTASSGAVGAGTCGTTILTSGYKGAPIKTKQMIFPLSSYSGMKVIQFSRLHSWVNGSAEEQAALTNFCNSNTNSPQCLGLIIHSVSLLRI